ncbi:BlaI/MecI/CopY family transcriptional regulator [uncultured Nocardioides sp.]|jgi:predicted transcriptional regulator|uniref:BlaI/MecI/CopY family transcriptional regulator n=1 Tax=uncultured Nocardioides sp. TaxID=198441 RepID=UPI0023B52310
MKSFGSLEERLMEAVWALDRPASVHEVTEALEGRPVAYTTTITVLERLRAKGWLQRSRSGRAYLYSATCDQHEYAARLMSLALDVTPDRDAALLSFAGLLDAGEAEQLRRALDEASSPTRE